MSAISAFKGLADPDSVAARRACAAGHPLRQARNKQIERTLMPVSQCLAEALEFRADIIAELKRCNSRIKELRSDQ